MVLAIPNPFQAEPGADTHYRSVLWRISRTDGVQFRFTSHDTELTFDDSTGDQLFSPVGAFDGSAHRREAGVRDQNLQASGPLVSGAVEVNDLVAGLFREAEVSFWLVDWRMPWVGALNSAKFWVGNVEMTGERWEPELVGLTSWLSHKVGRRFGRLCSADLGDARCGYTFPDLEDVILGVRVEAGSQDPTEPRRIFEALDADIVGTPLEDEYQHGKVEWTTGANVGVVSEVKVYTHTPDRKIELHLPTPFVIVDLDQFTLTTGCDRLLATCRDKFNIVLNYRGYPYMPGTDDVLETPTVC